MELERTDFSEIIKYKGGTFIFIFWKVLTDHLVLLKGVFHKILNFKDPS